MTNIFKKPGKKEMKKRLLQIGLETLRAKGWTVERTSGGASVRMIKKGGEQPRRISIRTSQDQWIAFPRNAEDSGWTTLSEVEVVLAVSVAGPEALVHWLEADELRERFDRAYKARLDANYRIPLGRGVWVPLYIPEDGTPTHAGGGAGLDHPEIARVPLEGPADTAPPSEPPAPSRSHSAAEDKPLTIAEAKRRLALTFGVSEANIKISVEA